MQEEKTSSGTIRYTMSPTLFPHRYRHVQVDSTGTISTVPFSSVQNLKRYFGLDQNKDLIEVNKKLRVLQSQIQDPSNEKLAVLKREIHTQKKEGAELLKSNLFYLNQRFKNGNRAQASTILKLLNYLRRLVHLEPIEHYTYELIDLELFKEKAIAPALELTAQEKESTKLIASFHLDFPFQLPANLNQENMQKLELGMKSSIPFSLDGKSFVISYDKEKQSFLFSYTDAANAPKASELVNSTQDQNVDYQSEPLNVLETTPDGTKNAYPLSFLAKYQSTHGWFGSYECSLAVKPSSKIEMKPQCQYTIPLSQGNLTIRIVPKSN